MIEFFRSLFGMRSDSGETAKERLRLVLLSDHLSLAPELLDALKADLLEVIARYVDIDRASADITFEHRDRNIAMLASVPVTGVRKNPPALAEPVADAPAKLPDPFVAEEPADDALDRILHPVQAAAAEVPADDPDALPLAVSAPQQSNQAPRPRRRRRRRPVSAAAPVLPADEGPPASAAKA